MEEQERVADALARVEGLVAGLAEEGLERLGPARVAELEEGARAAHRARLARLERELAGLAALGRRWLERDPTFRIEAWRGHAGRTWWLIGAARRALAGDGDPEEVLGVPRRRYAPVEGPLEVHALGASGWVSASGFVGITVHLAAPALGRVLEATVARPTAAFGEQPRRLWFQPVSEASGLTLQELSRGAWTLNGARRSADDRLSLHAGLEVAPAPPIGRRAYDPVAAAGAAGLVERLAPGVLDPLEGEARALVWLDGARVVGLTEDETRARAVVRVRDGAGVELWGALPLRPEHDRWIANLRRLATHGPGVLGLLGHAAFAGGALSFLPITAVLAAPIRLGPRAGAPVGEVHLSLEALPAEGG